MRSGAAYKMGFENVSKVNNIDDSLTETNQHKKKIKKQMYNSKIIKSQITIILS